MLPNRGMSAACILTARCYLGPTPPNILIRKIRIFPIAGRLFLSDLSHCRFDEPPETHFWSSRDKLSTISELLGSVFEGCRVSLVMQRGYSSVEKIKKDWLAGCWEIRIEVRKSEITLNFRKYQKINDFIDISA